MRSARLHILARSAAPALAVVLAVWSASPGAQPRPPSPASPASPASAPGPSPAAAAPARAAEQGPRWSALSAAQRQALAPLEKDWPQIDAGRKQKWLEVAQKFPAMSSAEQARVRERMAEWSRMTPAERGRARVQFQEARQLAPEDRQARWEAYQALPEEERRALAARAVAAERASSSARTEVRPPAAGVVAKQNLVTLPAAPSPVKPVAPTVVQARPGATTTLVSRASRPPAHQQPGLPKIAATREFVDPTTLLPTRGPQAPAALVAAAPASSPTGAESDPDTP